jgi:hypothetical protein
MIAENSRCDKTAAMATTDEQDFVEDVMTRL